MLVEGTPWMQPDVVEDEAELSESHVKLVHYRQVLTSLAIALLSMPTISNSTFLVILVFFFLLGILFFYLLII